jgi:DNA modification methylase
MNARVPAAAPITSPRQLHVQLKRLAELHPEPRNPRVHSAEQIRALARSVSAFGFNAPILIDGAGIIVAGHARALAAKEVGLESVPTICIDHLTKDQIAAYRIADNRIAELAQWDDALLAEQLKELADLDLSFDLEATGFSMGEIDLQIESLKGPGGASDMPGDDIPDVGQTAVSMPGEMWCLDKHRVLCGSALSATDYTRLMGGQQAGAVFTDPPYNVAIDGHASGNGAVRHREFAMASGEMTTQEFTAFLTDAIGLCAKQANAGAVLFICMDWRHIGELLAAGRATHCELLNLCVWAKDRAGMGSFYRSQHELVAVFRGEGARHQNNVQLGRFGRNRSNLWPYPSIQTMRRTEDGDLLAMHPTVKPVALVADAMLDCTRRGEVVLDPFLGSGTTVVAAYGMEIDPLYVDVIIRRWQAETRGTAQLADTGETFNERERGRPASVTPTETWTMDEGQKT